MNAPQTIAPRPATYQDVLDAPEHMVAEIVDGALYLHPRPAFRHQGAAGVINGELYGPYQRGRGGPGGWWILPEPELHFAGDVLVPDLAGWRRERLPSIQGLKWSEVAPDWVCEVESPSTRTLDRTRKRAIYGREGVRHLWLVDPAERVLESFELRDGAWWLAAAVGGEEAVRLAPFDALEFPLGDLWVD